jgi:hypothetical protein
MAKRGYDYVELPAPDFVGQSQLAAKQAAFTTEIASKVGYHLDQLPIPDEVRTADDAYNRVADANQARADSEPAFSKALIGADSGNDRGCQGEADSQVYGQKGSLQSFIPPAFADFGPSVSAAVRDDPQVAGALDAWKACVQSAGYNLEGLGDGPSRFLSTPTVSEDERRTASADAACRTTSGITSALSTSESAAVGKWLDENQSAVLAMKEVEDQLVSVAEKILLT